MTGPSPNGIRLLGSFGIRSTNSKAEHAWPFLNSMRRNIERSEPLTHFVCDPRGRLSLTTQGSGAMQRRTQYIELESAVTCGNDPCRMMISTTRQGDGAKR